VDSRSVAFLEVMASIGVVGLIAFLIFLVSRQAVRVPAQGEVARYQPHWLELLLAAAAVIIVAIALLWQFPPWESGPAASASTAAATDEAATANDSRGSTFFAVMLVIGIGGLVVFLITTLVRISRDRKIAAANVPVQPFVQGAATANQSGLTATSEAPAAANPVASHETPSTVRLLGLLGFGIAYLILNWSVVPAEKQFAMMLQLIYPAALVVALVMMFDKASRAWHIKQPGETVREWLFCNAIMVLFIIGYLNIQSVAEPAGYRAMFWDFLHVLGFLLVIWVIDRKVTRMRFLVAHAYLLLLPILLLIWQTIQAVPVVEDISWWKTLWPFFFLALIFFVLEIIVLIANRENTNQGAGTAKDVIFLILMVIVLIAARPAAIAS